MLSGFLPLTSFPTGTGGNMGNGGREKGRAKKKAGAAVRPGAHHQENF